MQPVTVSSPHFLGLIDHGLPGPVIVGIAAIHGNEIAGVEAARRVIAALEGSGRPLRGKFIALIGNTSAHRAGKRLIDEDLNRAWIPERIEAAASSRAHRLTSEEHERAGLLEAFDWIEQSSATDPESPHRESPNSGLESSALNRPFMVESLPARILVDLHTTSSPTAPFVALAVDGRARSLVEKAGLLEVRRTADYLHGMLVNYFARRGWSGFVFEAGAHRDPNSIRMHEALLWRVLIETGALDPADLPPGIHPLHIPQNGIPTAVEIFHHHLIRPGDGFTMRPGFRNFDMVEEGQVLAEDRHGLIHSPHSARIFLPLYQAEGEDGFFLVRDLP